MGDERRESGDELENGSRGEPTDNLMGSGDVDPADPEDDAVETPMRQPLEVVDDGDSLNSREEREPEEYRLDHNEPGSVADEYASVDETQGAELNDAVETGDDDAPEVYGTADERVPSVGSTEAEESDEAADEGAAPEWDSQTDIGLFLRNIVTDGPLTAIGQLINKSDARDKGRFLPVERHEWLEVEPVFVTSADCEAHLAAGDAFAHGPVLVLCGAAGTGKRACALQFAEQTGYLARTTTSTYRYHPPTGSEPPSLVEVLDDPETPRGALLIIENAFESRLAEQEVTGSSLSSLLGLLKEGTRRLLLTTCRQKQDVPNTVEVLSAELDDERLEMLRDKALEHRWPRGGPIRSPVTQLIVNNWTPLAKTLDRFGRIFDFIRLVAADSDKIGTPEQLEALAQEMVTPRPWSLSEWFSGLEGNELLMAFLVLFFPDLVSADLMVLYVRSVHKLRQDGVDLSDPRGRGIDDLLFKLRINQSEGPLAFDVPGRTDFVERQVANHRHLLLSLAELLLQDFKGLHGRGRWPFRKGLGTLIGHLGLFDERWMESRLRHLTQASGWQQNPVASYALVRLAEDDLRTSKDNALSIAGNWAKGGPELRWTAADSLWRVFAFIGTRREETREERFEELQHHVVNTLKRIMTQDWTREAILGAKEQARSDPRKKPGQLLYGWRFFPVLYSLVRCLQEHPAGVVPHIIGWLSREADDLSKQHQKDLRNVALQACELVLQRPSSTLAESFGRLSLAFFASTDPSNQTLQRIFRRLQSKLGEEELSAELFRGLLTVCLDGGELRRARLRRVLAETWTDTPEARALASRMVARSYALDGRFVAPLEIGRALLVYDPSIVVDWRRPVLKADEDEPRKHEEGNDAHVVRQLASLLAARFQLRLGVLGRVRTWTVDDPLSTSLQRGSRFPLLLPVLEEAASWKPDLVVLVSRGPIIDLDDLESHPAADRLIHVSVTDPDPEDAAPPAWYLAGDLTERRLDELEEVLEAHCIAAQREALAADWEPLTKRLGIDETLIAEDREAALRESCQLLWDPAEASGPDDIVRCLSAAFMAWAADDLPAAVDVLVRWLDPEGAALTEEESGNDGEPPGSSGENPAPSNESRVAAAATKALYRLYRGAALEPGDDHALLFDRLAWPLSMADPDGVATVLWAVTGWLGDPGWSEHLAGHGAAGAGGRGRLLRWAERFLPGRAQELADRLPSRSAEGADEELLSDLLHSLAGGPTYRPWPALAPGQRRALVVPDSLSPSGLGGLALRLAERAQRESPEDVPTIVRLGEVRPIWVPGSQRWAEAHQDSPPRLLVPLLECSEVDLGSVAFVLVLTSGPILDEADLLRSPWWPKIHVVRLAGSRAPLCLRLLTPDGAIVAALDEAEKLVFEMLMDCLDRDGAAAGRRSLGAN